MRRVSVVGVSGAGKSTMARRLAARLGVPHTELDSIHHQPHWEPLAHDEFRRRVRELAAGDGWVVDGNYRAVQPLLWERADTVVWLDLPRRTAMRRVTWRTLRRVVLRVELWNGNREHWRNVFARDEAESVIVWTWRHCSSYRERYTQAASDPANAHLRFVQLTTPAEVRRFLRAAALPALTSTGGEPLQPPSPPA